MRQEARSLDRFSKDGIHIPKADDRYGGVHFTDYALNGLCQCRWRPTDHLRCFGKSLEGPMEGHPPILPSDLYHYDLHVWLWKQNPAGMFNPVNPSVNCGKYPYSHTERTAVTRAHGH